MQPECGAESDELRRHCAQIVERREHRCQHEVTWVEARQRALPIRLEFEHREGRRRKPSPCCRLARRHRVTHLGRRAAARLNGGGVAQRRRRRRVARRLRCRLSTCKCGKSASHAGRSVNSFAARRSSRSSPQRPSAAGSDVRALSLAVQHLQRAQLADGVRQHTQRPPLQHESAGAAQWTDSSTEAQRAAMRTQSSEGAAVSAVVAATGRRASSAASVAWQRRPTRRRVPFGCVRAQPAAVLGQRPAGRGAASASSSTPPPPCATAQPSATPLSSSSNAGASSPGVRGARGGCDVLADARTAPAMSPREIKKCPAGGEQRRRRGPSRRRSRVVHRRYSAAANERAEAPR